jgi:cytoplasmic iron level regulating protein YaaA (DUF328/UPF0246 family)
MLFLISPAKTLDYDTPAPPEVLQRASTPKYLAQADALIDVLRGKSARQVARLMDLSPALAELNVGRYAAWSRRATTKNSKPAALAFDGDVYDGLQATTLSLADLEWAQQHLVILSGLYGALRPLDRLQPYRLEMGTALPTPAGRDLYEFWGDTIARHLNQRVAGDAAPTVINLASQEYARVALRPTLKARVIDCVFEEWKGGEYKIISFFAKKARGLMARHAVLQRATVPEALLGFTTDGYRHDRRASSENRFVFRRRA